MKKKIFNLKKNKGMTYVELIIVLSIFGIMAGVVLFNYDNFKARIQLRKLTNEITLKIHTAQKNAMAGVLPAQYSSAISNWRPAYGLSFDLENTDHKSFIFFTDLNNIKGYDSGDCSSFNNECIEEIKLNKGFLKSVDIATLNWESSFKERQVDLVFTRPSSGMEVYVNNVLLNNVEKVSLIINTVIDNSIPDRIINIYPSGKIEIK